MTQSDPSPETTPGLEPGGGVAPGDTTADSSSTAEEWATRQPNVSSVWGRVGVLIVVGGAVLVGILFLIFAIVRGVSIT